nr:DUF6498-containing protein [Microlunatus panaciterrae]
MSERYPTNQLPAYGAGAQDGHPVGNPFLGGAPTSGAPAPPAPEGGADTLWLPIALSVVMNLVSIVGVVVFGWPAGNIFALFWVENVIIGFWSLIKVASARGTGGSGVTNFTVNGVPRQPTSAALAPFFCLHYGIFCLVHGVFTSIVAFRVGVELNFWFFGFPAILIMIRYLVETLTTWFGRGGQRERVSPGAAMMAPYPRIIVLHLAVILAFMVTMGGVAHSERLAQLKEALAPVLARLPEGAQGDGVLIVLILMVIKTIVDVLTTRKALRAGR